MNIDDDIFMGIIFIFAMFALMFSAIVIGGLIL